MIDPQDRERVTEGGWRKGWFGSLASLPLRAMILCIRFYQRAISPMLGPSCRFQPTCSAYFIASLKKHGIFFGTAKGVWRIARCQPFCKGGYDPP